MADHLIGEAWRQRKRKALRNALSMCYVRPSVYNRCQRGLSYNGLMTNWPHHNAHCVQQYLAEQQPTPGPDQTSGCKNSLARRMYLIQALTHVEDRIMSMVAELSPNSDTIESPQGKITLDVVPFMRSLLSQGVNCNRGSGDERCARMG